MIQGVIQVLINDSKVKQALGALAKTGKVKVYPVLADQEESTPFSVCTIITNEPNQCKESRSVMDRVRFEISTYSQDYAEMDNIDAAIRFSLDGFKGLSAGIDLDIWFESHRDGFDSNMYYARISQYSAFVTRSVN